jgi:uracil-DNA glycosylase family 4
MATRRQHMAVLEEQITSCDHCDGMNVRGVTQAAPGYGSVRSPVVIVGQSLCEPCMETQIPFTGGSGKLLDASFAKVGIAKNKLFITNLVHCHPPKNRKSFRHWINNCSPYLHRELSIVRPRLVIGLGRDAEAALRSRYPEARILSWPFRTPRATTPVAESAPALLFVEHPSWINRQHDAALEKRYVSGLARALKWGLRDIAPPT